MTSAKDDTLVIFITMNMTSNLPPNIMGMNPSIDSIDIKGLMDTGMALRSVEGGWMEVASGFVLMIGLIGAATAASAVSVHFGIGTQF